MKRFGLAAIFKFVDKGATRGFGRASRSAKALSVSLTTLKRVGGGLSRTFGGVGRAAISMGAQLGVLGGGAGVGLALKKFSDFEGRMGAVKSVLGEQARPEFAALEQTAKKMGATTVFTAEQSAEAMEALARAGLKPRQVIEALRPVLSGAAADGIEIAQAADIGVANLAAFGLGVKDMTRIMDTLAFVSRNTKSNMLSLQEGLKFVAPKARSLGISFEDTTAAVGALNDVGLDATLAGTALKNALIKISTNAKRGAVRIKGFSAKIVQAKDGSLDLKGSMDSILKNLAKIKDPLKRSAIATKLFGIRGEGAAGAFAALTDQKIDTLFKNLAGQAKGTADEMAKMRLDNFSGDMVRLSSAMDGLLINFGKMVVSVFDGTRGAQGLTQSIGQLSKAFGFFAKNPNMLDKAIQIEGVDAGVQDFARTVIKAFQTLNKVLKFTVDNMDTLLTLMKIGAGAKVLGFLNGMTGGVAGGLVKRGLVGGATSGAGGAAAGNIGGLAGLLAKPLGKLFGGVKGVSTVTGLFKGGILSVIGPLGAVAAAAVGVGTALDRMFGISDKLSDTLLEMNGRGQEGLRRKAKQAEAIAVNAEAQRMANQLAKLSQSGVTKFQTAEGGDRVALTREAASKQISTMLERQGRTDKEISKTLLALESTLRGIRPAAENNGQKKPIKPAKDALIQRGGLIPVSSGDMVLDRASLARAITSQTRGGLISRTDIGTAPKGGSGGAVTINVPVMMDGRQIALGVAKVKLEDLERQGASIAPGDRQAMMQRGFRNAI